MSGIIPNQPLIPFYSNQENEKWNNLFKKGDEFVGKLNNSLFIHYFQNSVLSRLIYYGFEISEIAFVRRYLCENDTFIDIGANIGLYSLHSAQVVGKKGKVIAFEPASAPFKRLLMNVRLNNFEDIITCNNIGLADKKGILKMNISSNGYDAWNTFATWGEGIFNIKQDVHVETFDNYLKNNNLNIKDITLIKVDVEGWEEFVIKGAEGSLKNRNAPALLVEFTETNAYAAGTSCYKLFDLIKSYGYNWYTYDCKKNQLLPEIKRSYYPYNNLIALKNLNKARRRLLKINPPCPIQVV